MKPRPSAIVLLGVNMLPIAGVLLFDWRVFDILILYWIENVIIGVINLLRMAVASGGLGGRRISRQLERAGLSTRQRRRVDGIGKLILLPFFTVHYGLFCWGHLSAVLLLFAGDSSTASLTELFFGAGSIDSRTLWLGAGGIAISHLYSFFGNFIGAGEYRRSSVALLMHRPYGRIIALHIAVIAGGALITYLGEPVLMLIVLVVVKTLVDWRMHERERRLLGATAPVESSDS